MASTGNSYSFCSTSEEMMTGVQSHSIGHVPYGFRFHPTDEELLRYLEHKIAGQPWYSGGLIQEKELYAKEPWLIERIDLPGLKENEQYYYVKLEKASGPTGKRIKRTVEGEEGGGWWHGNTRDEQIFSQEGQLIGFKRSFTFFKNQRQPGVKKTRCKKDEGEKSDWIMHEYRLPSDDFQPWVICHIRHKVKDGRANIRMMMTSMVPFGDPGGSDAIGDHNMNAPDSAAHGNPQATDQQGLLNDDSGGMASAADKREGDNNGVPAISYPNEGIPEEPREASGRMDFTAGVSSTNQAGGDPRNDGIQIIPDADAGEMNYYLSDTEIYEMQSLLEDVYVPLDFGLWSFP